MQKSDTYLIAYQCDSRSTVIHALAKRGIAVREPIDQDARDGLKRDSLIRIVSRQSLDDLKTQLLDLKIFTDVIS